MRRLYVWFGYWNLRFMLWQGWEPRKSYHRSVHAVATSLGFVSPEQCAVRVREAGMIAEATALLASQAKEVGDMYKKLLETTTQERIKFFNKDPRGLYANAMQRLLVGQQFFDAYMVFDAVFLAGGAFENRRELVRLREHAVAFREALREMLP